MVRHSSNMEGIIIPKRFLFPSYVGTFITLHFLLDLLLLLLASLFPSAVDCTNLLISWSIVV
jgi:hypothetical protein